MSNRTPVGVGIVGCGNIFSSYMRGLGSMASVKVIGCADVDQARADAAAKVHDIEAFPSVEALLEDGSVEVVVNITPPLAHASVSTAAIGNGKHVYVEKPIAASLTDLPPLVAALKQAGAGGGRLGCAPDTFLSSPGQTARAALDSGLIGEPIGFSAVVPHSRMEEWHPDPRIFFTRGGGPLLDMGPYYITSLVNCLGPVASVAGAARIGANPRVVTTPERVVDSVDVSVPTHSVAVLKFASGVVGTLMASFDLWSDHLPHIEIYGTEGILRLPDPDRFNGDVLVRLNRGGDDWAVVPPVVWLAGWSGSRGLIRGLGVADLVDSLGGRPQRTTAELGYHVLEVLSSVELSSENDSIVHLQCKPGRPAPVGAGDLGGIAVTGPDAERLAQEETTETTATEE